MSVKEVPESYQLALNILCVTYFVTSSISMLQALQMENLSVYDK